MFGLYQAVLADGHDAVRRDGQARQQLLGDELAIDHNGDRLAELLDVEGLAAQVEAHIEQSRCQAFSAMPTPLASLSCLRKPACTPKGLSKKCTSPLMSAATAVAWSP
jgi:hypothetical protein